jgi:hypothetical protein
MHNFLRNKGLYILLIISLLILLFILAGLLLIGHKPAFYKDYSSVPQEELELRAENFLQHLLKTVDLVKQGQHFHLEIKEDEVNSFLAGLRADDLASHLAEEALSDWPGDVRPPPLYAWNPQVHFLPPKNKEEGLGKIILAIEVRPFHLNTIVSAHFRLEKTEMGESLKVEKLRAGALPIPRWLFRRPISEVEQIRLETVFEEAEIEYLRLEQGRLKIVGRGISDED